TDDNAVGIYKATVTNLLNTVACPSGTEVGTGTCWTTGAAINITSLNSFLSSPHIASDQRSTGTGAGDVYTVVTQANPNNGKTSISLTACTNGLNCSKSITVSGADQQADFSWVQVRPDGKITISYRNTTFPGINPEQIRFVTCTPNGAPQPPTCSAATLV